MVDSKQSIADHTGISADSHGPAANSQDVVHSSMHFADAPAATSTNDRVGTSARMGDSQGDSVTATREHSEIEEVARG